MVLQRANRTPWVGNREAGLGVSEGLGGRVTVDLWAVPRVPLGTGFPENVDKAIEVSGWKLAFRAGVLY